MVHVKETTREIRNVLNVIDASTDDRFDAVDKAFREIEGLARRGRREVKQASYQNENPAANG